MIFGRHIGSGWVQTGFPLYLLVLVIWYFMSLRSKSKSDQFRLILLATSVALIIDMTLFPMALNQEAINHVIEKHTFSFNLVPLVKGYEAIKYQSLRILVEMFLNIILFVPFGFAVQRFIYGKKNAIWNTVVLALVLSFGIELIQLISMYQGLNVRIFDIDDLILNTLGGFIGAYIAKRKR